MARYVATVETSWDREQAFAYLADFASVSEWDPGIELSRRVAGGFLEAGSAYLVVSSFLGRKIELRYETLEIESPRRVLLRAETPTISSVDEMTFVERPGGGTVVTYDADLRLKGVLGRFDPLLRIGFQRIGDDAKEGLAEKLAEAPPAPAEAEAS